MTARPRRAAGPPPRQPREAFRDELEHIRREKEQALANSEFERAASLRNRERLLSASFGADVEEAEDFGLLELGPSRDPARLALVGGLVVAALGFPLGLLAGWLIWG